MKSFLLFITGLLIYSSGLSQSQNVGIGTTTPAHTLDAIGNTAITGNFVNTSTNGTGVVASSLNTPGQGWGVYGEGGSVGVEGVANLPGEGERFGVSGNGNYGTYNFGVKGDANGGTSAYGVYGSASGAANSYGVYGAADGPSGSTWAGYFNGDVFATRVGIGTTPEFPLSFPPVLGDKISLWSNSTNSYGFGIQIGQLQIHTDISAADIVFGYGSSGSSDSFNETMRIKGNGNVGIGTTSPGNFKLRTVGWISSNTGFDLTDANANGNTSYNDAGPKITANTMAGNAELDFISPAYDAGPIAFAFLKMSGAGSPYIVDAPNPLMVIKRNGNIYIDPSNKNDGTVAGNTLLFGTHNGTGEGIGSKRTASGNQYGLDFYTSNNNRMSISNAGQVGIGNSDPSFQLDVSNRMRIRSGGNLTNTAGLWLNGYANNLAVFIGMEDDSHVSFFGVGIGWKFGMNVLTGALKVNGSEGQPGQVIVSAGAAAPSWGYANSHYIGETYGGGIVFYVYDNGQHGLIAATADQSTTIQWSNGIFRPTGATGDGVSAGSMNTALIVATQIGDYQPDYFAAKLCADFSETVAGVRYGDWYLPSLVELNLLYLQRNVVGGFASSPYWSSTEFDYNDAWYVDFFNGVHGSFYNKSSTIYVRAIRAF